MSDRDALLRAICESPEEDTPRLAYADLVEGDGEFDRAEFIRTQIQLERTEPGARGRAALVTRKNELLRRHGDVWATEVGMHGVSEVQFRRGFIDAVAATAHAFLGVPDLHNRVPLRSARLTHLSGFGGANASQFGRLTRLEIIDPACGDADLAALAGVVPKQLTQLLIVGNGRAGRTCVSDTGVPALAQLLQRTRLAAVVLSGNGRLGADGLAGLMGTTARRLRELYLLHTVVDRRGVDVLTGGGFRGLTALGVRGSRIGDDGLAALVTSGQLPRLASLSVRRARVTTTGIAAALASPRAKRWPHLEISGRGTVTVFVAQGAGPRAGHQELGWNPLKELLRVAVPCAFTTSRFVDAQGRERSGPRVLG